MLTIICPSIRPQYWIRLYNSVQQSCSDFELVFVGPVAETSLLREKKVKYIKDYGSPARCFQIGLELAEGEYVTYTSDDCIARPGAIDKALELCQGMKDIVTMRYSESPGFSGPPHCDAYYKAGYHEALRVPGVDPNWDIPIIFLMRTDYCHHLGGIDCRFFHINMNCHDLCFRAQRDGAKCHLSPEVVWDADYIHRGNEDPIINAFLTNDKPLFDKVYSEDRPIKINLHNWRDAERVWRKS